MTNANTLFGSSNGSETFYQNSKLLIYTDGVRELAEACGAYWLVDLISSYQMSKTTAAHPFQVWELKRVTADAFQIVATDGNDKRIACQSISFSDFKYDLATLWLVDGCLMLPKEY